MPWRDEATGFTFVRARWYDAATASFLTPDPLGYADASALYAYAASDPVNFRDPTGMQAEGVDGEEDGQGWFKTLRLAASMGLGAVPVLGDALDVVQVVTGYDVIAGDKLSATERAVTAMAMAIPGVSGAAMRKTVGAAGDLLKHSDEAVSIASRNTDEIAGASAKNTDEVVAAAAHRADAIASNASAAFGKTEVGLRGAAGGGSAETYLISERRAARYQARLQKLLTADPSKTVWKSRTKADVFKGSRRERLAEFAGRIEMMREGQLRLGSGKYTSIHGIDAVYFDYHQFASSGIGSKIAYRESLAGGSSANLSVLESKYRSDFVGDKLGLLLGRGIKVVDRRGTRYARQMSNEWIDIVIERLRANPATSGMGVVLDANREPLRRYVNVLTQYGTSVMREIR